ncbi:TIM barrel protein [Acidocella facilis]|uniref:TIM barrel protein n=1 Tax=Acidocella facilis TaxID=525 RepID=UPI001F29DA90|nr:TIM barrel protein [Acidocella facilis]
MLCIHSIHGLTIFLRAESLADYAQACKARALVMCPLNNGTAVSESPLIDALREMAPILRSRNLTGLVEPLGFPVSSMRTKREAIRAIEAAGAEDVYRLVHDTFHHHLAGESEYFPDWTGLVHISGVTEATPQTDALLDKHRVLVNARDRIETLVQLRTLKERGYSGPVSMEPFAPEVHDDPHRETRLGESYSFVARAMS